MEEEKIPGNSNAENKKVWVKPEVQVLDKDFIKSGSSSQSPEGVFVVTGVFGSAS